MPNGTRSTNRGELSFESFWEQYPRDERKSEAKRAFSNAIARDGPGPIEAGLRTWAPHWDDPATDLAYEPYACNWLDGSRYLEGPPKQGKRRRRSVDLAADALILAMGGDIGDDGEP